MGFDFTNHQQVVELLSKNYTCLQKLYRLGRFEEKVKRGPEWRGPGAEQSFYELTPAEESDEDEQDDDDAYSLKEAVENFYRLIRHADLKWPAVRTQNGVLLLKGKLIVYEMLDYFLVGIPPELEKSFIDDAGRFMEFPQPRRMERWAEEVNGGEFGEENHDKRTEVVKNLLIASLFGANHYYRQYGTPSLNRALALLDKIKDYVEKELPAQHREPRKSFGLLGLTLFLKGRILLAQGAYARSREAFRQSADAYVARVRQKEEFQREGRISKTEMREKISITLRRAALVTAFGDGYLSFITSEITRALETLRLARAALTQNSGHTYLTYVDTWYWACMRAAHSSDRETMNKVVGGLRHCHGRLSDLAEGSSNRYVHQTGVQLALALYYRAKLLARAPAEADLQEAWSLLNAAIQHTRAMPDGKHRNLQLRTDALIYRSYFLRDRFRRLKGGAAGGGLDYLMQAKEDATEARDVSDGTGIAPMKSEAWAALGSVHTDLADYYGTRDENFYANFDRAGEALRQALKENGGENARLEAACYLRLAKLCILNPNTEILAYDYFEQWKRLEGRVEHAYLKVMAQDFLRKNKIAPLFRLVKPDPDVTFKAWEEAVLDFLIDAAMTRFAAIHEKETHSVDEWRRMTLRYLLPKSGYSETWVKDRIDSMRLVEKVLKLKDAPKDGSADRIGLRSYTADKEDNREKQ